MNPDREFSELADSIDDILSNIKAVRGPSFALVVRLTFDAAQTFRLAAYMGAALKEHDAELADFGTETIKHMTVSMANAVAEHFNLSADDIKEATTLAANMVGQVAAAEQRVSKNI